MITTGEPVAVTGGESKASLRSRIRSARRELDDRPARSVRIAGRLNSLVVVRSARRMMVFSTIPGEPEMSPVADAARSRGAEVCVPEDRPDPSWPDVVVVPGLAFTLTGDRLGQGGGWYDRFLSGRSRGATAVGVGFDLQLVDHLPIEEHDERVDAVITESGVWWAT